MRTGRTADNAKRVLSRIVILAVMLQNFASATPSASAATQQGVAVKPMIAAGYRHSVALKSDGTVWTWGQNNLGQLGDGTNTASAAPVQVVGPGGSGHLTSITAIASLADFTLALKSDGTVWAWGQNNNGQLGDGSYAAQNTPVQVAGLSGVSKIAAGFGHSIALKSDGTVWGWGRNYYGMVGNGFDHTSAPTGTHDTEATPQQATGISDVVAIATGGEHTMALKSDGTLWAWGASFEGEIGTGSTTWSNVPVQVSTISGVKAIGAGFYHSLAVEADGTAWAWGDNWAGMLGDGSNTQRLTPVQVSGLANAVTIDGGDYHSFARTADGSVWVWGDNSYGQLGDGTVLEQDAPEQLTTFAPVAMVTGGGSHTLFEKADGSVWAAGSNAQGQLGDGTNTDRVAPTFSGIYLFAGPDAVVGVQGGSLHSVALKADGSVWAWGYNADGEVGDGTTSDRSSPVQVSGLSGAVAVSAGAYHSLALKSDGTVWAWGNDGEGQLGDGGNTNQPAPEQVSGLANVVAIAAGDYHSFALKADGTMWSWGRNVEGQLGNGDAPNDSGVPVQVSGLTDVVAIGSDSYAGLAVMSDGTVRAWGRNTEGELGDGTNTASDVPVTVTGLSTAVAAGGGAYHSVALLSDGTVRAWGNDFYGNLGDGTNTDSNVPVTVSGLSGVTMIAASNGGGDFALARKDDGTVWAWGRDDFGEFGDGSNSNSNVPVQTSNVDLASDVAVVGAGADHGLAIKSDGSLWAWGYNFSGGLGIGTNTDTNVPVRVSFSTGGGCSTVLNPRLAYSVSTFSEFHVVTPSGAPVTDLTGSSATLPAFKPDGTRLAFVTSQDGNFEIYEMHTDGSAQHDLTLNAGNDTLPSYSPDGTKIVFVSDRDGSVWQVYSMNADGTGQTRLENDGDGSVGAPVFSPDGTKIYFVKMTGVDTSELYSMDPDGGNLTAITALGDYISTFSVNGAGTQIAFAAAATGGGNSQIYVVDPTGTGLANISNNAYYDSDPAFKPDGTKIAFASDRSGTNIFAMDPDGFNVMQLTTSSYTDSAPVYSPNGARIAYIESASNPMLHIMDANGANDSWISNNVDSKAWGSIAECAPGGGNPPTTSNRVLMSRLKAGATSEVSLSFSMTGTVSTQLTVSFDPAFSGLDLTGVTATTPDSPSCMSNFQFVDGHTFTADKSGCTGSVLISGFHIVNPSTPGSYPVTWVNDAPGGGDVFIVEDDQVVVDATVDPSITFDVGSQTDTATCDTAFTDGGSVALGALSPSAVTSSDQTGISHICTKVSTNALGGATVAVASLNGELKSASTADFIPSSTGTVSASDENYGLCAGSTSGDFGHETTSPDGVDPAASSPYDAGSCTATAHAIGHLTTAPQTVWQISGPSQNAFYRLLVKASASPTTPAHADYGDTLTFTATGIF